MGSRVETMQLDGEACGRFFWVTQRLDADVNEVPIHAPGYDSKCQVKTAHNAMCLLADKWF
jgi:hypothetical protein